MPPMFPICKSRMTRSASRSCSAPRTSAPLDTVRIVVFGPIRTARSSLSSHWASVAISTSGITARVAAVQRWVPSRSAVSRSRDGEDIVLNIELEQTESGYTICRPVGELDAFTVSQFRQTLAELASSPQLLIDMSGVPFVDSAGLGALIGGIRRARELGGDVAVACDRPTLVRLLRTTGFDRIVTVAETVDEAIAALSKDLEPEV